MYVIDKVQNSNQLLHENIIRYIKLLLEIFTFKCSFGFGFITGNQLGSQRTLDILLKRVFSLHLFQDSIICAAKQIHQNYEIQQILSSIDVSYMF
jgi:hypothetical protein